MLREDLEIVYQLTPARPAMLIVSGKAYFLSANDIQKITDAIGGNDLQESYTKVTMGRPFHLVRT